MKKCWEIMQEFHWHFSVPTDPKSTQITTYFNIYCQKENIRGIKLAQTFD